MKRFAFALMGAISLSACAQAPQPGAANQAPGAQAATAKGPAQTAPAAGATAKAGTPEARAIEAVRRLNPQIVVDRVAPAPLKGFQEVVVQGQVAYVTDDGQYLFLPGPQGALYDTVAQTNVSEQSMAKMRKELIKTVPLSERIVFAPATKPKHTVAVFTDIECGYCRKFHTDIAEYNRQGIEVQYMAFPRMGLGSEDHKKMISVWCSADRRKALTSAKADVAIPSKDCKNTVTMQYDVGQRAGLTGTPMIIAEDGTQVGGYLPPAELRQALDKLAAGRQAPAASTAADPVASSSTGG